jgi:hypothetical protein
MLGGREAVIPLHWGIDARVRRTHRKLPAKNMSGSLIGRDAQRVDQPDDDRVVAGGVLGDDLALEGGEGVAEKRDAAAAGLQVEARNRSAPAGVARIANSSC